MWLQGFDNAPEICKACFRSWRKWYPDYKIIVLDEKNIFDYISLPDYVINKHSEQKIIHALYCDIIRLELLFKYGGTWVDSTIYCTGRRPEFERMLTLPLAFFQVNDPNSVFTGATWFITSDEGSPTLKLTRDLLFEYWNDYDHAIHYYIIDMFLKMAKQKFLSEWQNIPYYSCDIVHALQFHGMYEEYSPELMKKFTDLCDFHKLTYKLKQTPSENSVYKYLIKSV